MPSEELPDTIVFGQSSHIYQIKGDSFFPNSESDADVWEGHQQAAGKIKIFDLENGDTVTSPATVAGRSSPPTAAQQLVLPAGHPHSIQAVNGEDGWDDIPHFAAIEGKTPPKTSVTVQQHQQQQREVKVDIVEEKGGKELSAEDGGEKEKGKGNEFDGLGKGCDLKECQAWLERSKNMTTWEAARPILTMALIPTGLLCLWLCIPMPPKRRSELKSETEIIPLLVSWFIMMGVIGFYPIMVIAYSFDVNPWVRGRKSLPVMGFVCLLVFAATIWGADVYPVPMASLLIGVPAFGVSGACAAMEILGWQYIKNNLKKLKFLAFWAFLPPIVWMLCIIISFCFNLTHNEILHVVLASSLILADKFPSKLAAFCMQKINPKFTVGGGFVITLLVNFYDTTLLANFSTVDALLAFIVLHVAVKTVPVYMLIKKVKKANTHIEKHESSRQLSLRVSDNGPKTPTIPAGVSATSKRSMAMPKLNLMDLLGAKYVESLDGVADSANFKSQDKWHDDHDLEVCADSTMGTKVRYVQVTDTQTTSPAPGSHGYVARTDTPEGDLQFPKMLPSLEAPAAPTTLPAKQMSRANVSIIRQPSRLVAFTKKPTGLIAEDKKLQEHVYLVLSGVYQACLAILAPLIQGFAFPVIYAFMRYSHTSWIFDVSTVSFEVYIQSTWFCSLQLVVFAIAAFILEGMIQSMLGVSMFRVAAAQLEKRLLWHTFQVLFCYLCCFCVIFPFWKMQLFVDGRDPFRDL
eukprot:GDKI01032013.1.p1 GENE.GDKI01032013.1~~GDKI01032013.1.p1  ORF type:complete len:776 (-),score=193.87 GDKI01032013.1:40-2277(-)